MCRANRKHAEVKALAPLRFAFDVVRQISLTHKERIQHVTEGGKDPNGCPDAPDDRAIDVAVAHADGEKAEEENRAKRHEKAYVGVALHYM